MNIIICGATGFVGRSLVPALLKEKHIITVVGRDIDKINKTFNHSIDGLSWDQLKQLSPDNYDAVINLAGKNIGDCRWTSKNKAKIKESRVISTKYIIDWCLTAKNTKPHLYNASAIGIYGLQAIQEELPPALTESLALPVELSPSFVREITLAWEKAASAPGISVTLMRFGVVLKRHEGMLKKLELPFSLGLGSLLGGGRQALSWVHIDDLVNAIIFLLQHPDVTGAINICAPSAVSQKTFAETLAHVMHRPLMLHLPTPLIEILFGQMGKELLLGSQHIYPERLKELGFNFCYPNLNAALEREWKRTPIR